MRTLLAAVSIAEQQCPPGSSLLWCWPYPELQAATSRLFMTGVCVGGCDSSAVISCTTAAAAAAAAAAAPVSCNASCCCFRGCAVARLYQPTYAAYICCIMMYTLPTLFLRHDRCSRCCCILHSQRPPHHQITRSSHSINAIGQPASCCDPELGCCMCWCKVVGSPHAAVAEFVRPYCGYHQRR
jgi:hypothetical protein